jgi:hypothetical protein
MSTFFFNIYIDRVINKIDTNEKLQQMWSN